MQHTTSGLNIAEVVYVSHYKQLMRILHIPKTSPVVCLYIHMFTFLYCRRLEHLF